ADRIVMPENAFLMVHKPQALCVGDVDAMTAMVGDLQRMTNTFAKTYAGRTGGKKTDTDMHALMKEARLIDAPEAYAFGLVDERASRMLRTAHYDLARLREQARARVKEQLDIVAHARAEENERQLAAQRAAADKLAKDAVGQTMAEKARAEGEARLRAEI